MATMDPFPIGPHNENTDPFVVTPPRKLKRDSHTITPSTPKSTPLHKRFLEEVRMSPVTSTTPPRTPSRSPARGQSSVEQTLQVGLNGFYFSMEIPERTTPKKTGRMASSPEKQDQKTKNQGSIRGTGRVKDILRKNLFGTPRRQAVSPTMCAKSAKDSTKDDEMSTKPPNESTAKSSPSHGLKTCGDGGSEGGRSMDLNLLIPENEIREVASESTTTTATTEESHIPGQPSPAPPTMIAPSTKNSPPSSTLRSQEPELRPSTPATTAGARAAPTASKQKMATASTPLNIGHMMAGLTSKSSKSEMLPTPSDGESMPTPLRKMSERLGLRSPNVTWKGELSTKLQRDSTESPSSLLKQEGDTASEDQVSTQWSVVDANIQDILATPTATSKTRNNDTITQLLSTVAAAVPSIDPLHPKTATSSTPRPGPPIRSQSFGTPTRLRSSIQQDMFKVQESLKRSLGSDFTFRTGGTRPATPVSPSATLSSADVSDKNDSQNTSKKAPRPVSMVGLAKSSEMSSTQAVPRRPMNTAARKPRPKSMIVGSAKILETIAAQVDSPRERTKLRSAATTHSNARSGPATSRSGPTTSASRRPTSTTGGISASRPQLIDPNGRPTASREVAPAKHPAPAAPTTITRGHKQQPASAEAIAGRVAKWKTEDRKNAAPKFPTRTAKAPSTVPPKQTPKRTAKTPEPRDRKSDSGVGESYTPPGNPTRLPSPIKSPSKTRLVIPVTPAPKKTAPPTKTPAADATRLETVLPLKTPVNRRIDPRDPNAMRTPSKEVESSLDRAIDAKIAEDARSGKEFTPSGNRISELLEAKRGQQSYWL